MKAKLRVCDQNVHLQLIFESVSVEIALIITNFSVQNLDSQQCNMVDKHVSRAPKDRGQTIKIAFQSDVTHATLCKACHLK